MSLNLHYRQSRVGNCDEALERATEEKTSTIYFLRFELSASFVASVYPMPILLLESITNTTGSAWTACQQRRGIRWFVTLIDSQSIKLNVDSGFGHKLYEAFTKNTL